MLKAQNVKAQGIAWVEIETTFPALKGRNVAPLAAKTGIATSPIPHHPRRGRMDRTQLARLRPRSHHARHLARRTVNEDRNAKAQRRKENRSRIQLSPLRLRVLALKCDTVRFNVLPTQLEVCNDRHRSC